MKKNQSKDLDYTTDSCFILKLASFMIQKVNDEREKKPSTFTIKWTAALSNFVWQNYGLNC